MSEEKRNFPSDSNPPTPEQIRQALTGPAGQQLIRLLRGANARELQRALALWRQGDVEAAKAALGPIMDSPQAADLLGQISGQMHGGD